MAAEIWIKYFAVVAIGGLYLLRRSLRDRDVPPPKLKELLADDDASARTIDFTLTTITVLPIVLTTVQFFFVLHASFYVKHAAFATARSAAVVIGEDYEAQYRAEGEGRNFVGSQKERTLLECAAWAVSPVSPTADDIVQRPIVPLEFLAYTSRYYPGIWLTAMGPMRAGLLDRARFARFDTWEHKAGNAMLQTDVEVIPESTDGDPFAPNEPVTVRVKYRYNLTVPIARQILKDTNTFFGLPVTPQYFETSPLGQVIWLTAGVKPYVTISARTTTVNEGWGDNPDHFTQPEPEKPGILDTLWQGLLDIL